MATKKQPPSLWTKAAYRATNDITTVAIYRIASFVMGTVLLGMLGYFGNRMVTGEDRMQIELATTVADIVSIHTAIGEINGKFDMMDKRDQRIIDRLNSDEARLTGLEVKMDLLMANKHFPNP